MMTPKLFRSALCALAAFAGSQASSATPGSARLTIGAPRHLAPVVWGVDAKLTAKGWAENPAATDVARRLFVDGGFTVFRLPIYAMRPVSDPLYAKIAGLARQIRAANPGVLLFASVANGDGDQNNWLHGAEKFPADMKGGKGIYDLNLDRYAAYLDDYLRMMQAADARIDWLGAFNEDPAKAADLQHLWRTMTRLEGVRRIGVESMALRASTTNAPPLTPLVDIVGSHFYDDDEGKKMIPRAEWESAWVQLVASAGGKPVWFTEATDYREFDHDRIDDLLDGLARLVPALNAGIDGVVLYQAVPRIVNYDNTVAAKKWSGLEAFIQSTAHSARLASTCAAPDTFCALVCRGRNGLELHLVNSGAEPLELSLALSPAPTLGARAAIRRWDAQTNGATDSVALGAEPTLTVPARSYLAVRFDP